MNENWLKPEFERALVSVIIPSHNQEAFLPASLESIADQDYRPIEVIIVDDGSTDGTRKIMKYFEGIRKEGITTKCFYQSQHGAQQARNEGCKLARGEFIQFLDGDDVLCPGKLSEQVIVLKTHNDIDVVYGDGQYLVDSGETQRKGRIISIGPSPDIVESLLFGLWVPSFSYLSRRSAIQRCGPWDNTFMVSQDFEYFLRLAIRGCRFSYRDGITGFYRKHSFASVSEQSPSILGRTRQRILVQAEKWLRQQGEFKEQRVHAAVENYRRIARQAYPTDKECFGKSLDEVIRLCPQYLPPKPRARLIASIIGFRNYETLAAMISRIIYKDEKDWF